ncbi:MAG TPA: LysR substrate-binding domain-containing protein [Burkholderiaceae bacterium]|jgi:DNA-binding transcriptional LysR family regulator|nr:LysR substrate-binding domain-containing protein [Burkholderiaceae bacterium]
MRNIDLDSLQIFKAVAELGSITKAAGQLNRVQSNITTRIKNLERRLGVMLFQRQNGKMQVSAEGKLLLGYTERLLRLSTEAEAAVRSGNPCGTLRIGTMESTAAARLPPLLSRYHAANPEVQIELVTGTSGALVSKVHNHEIEAAFVAQPFAADGLDKQAAFVEELVLIAARGARAAKTPRDLRIRTLIAFPTGCSYRRILEDWLGRAAIVPDRVLELGSYHAMVACAAAGSGLAIMPRSVLATMRAESEVTVFPLPERVAKARTFLVWRNGHRSAALDAMRAELRRAKPDGR